MRLAFATATLVGALVLSIGLHAAEWMALSRAGQWLLNPDGQRTLPTLPWGGHGAADLRRSLSANWTMVGPEHAERKLLELARAYPLDSSIWMELARIEAGRSQPSSDEVGRRLSAAIAAEPHNRRVKSRASQVAMQVGKLDLAGDLLRQSIERSPGEVRVALAMAARWLHDPDELVERIVPATPQHHEFAMRHAVNQRNLALAEAIWRRAADSSTIDDRVLLDYVDALLREEAIDRAVTIWREHDPDFVRFGVPNAHFTLHLNSERGLGWRILEVEGVRIGRDTEIFHSPPASLQTAFAGQENINLTSPSVLIPVEGGKSYRLSGFWRGQGLTTRSRPYLLLQSVRGGLRAEQAVPGGQFDWTEWRFEFSVPSEVNLIRLALRRDETVAFDRNIGGRLWLDSLHLEALSEVARIDPAEGP